MAAVGRLDSGVRRNDGAKMVRGFGVGRPVAGADFCGNRLIFGGKLPGFNPLEFEETGNGVGRNSYFPSAGE